MSRDKFWTNDNYSQEYPLLKKSSIEAVDLIHHKEKVISFEIVVYTTGGHRFSLGDFITRSDANDFIKKFLSEIK